MSPRRWVHIRLYWVAVVLAAVAAGPVVAVQVATKTSDDNARDIIAQYKQDQAAEQEQARQLSCRLSGSQMGAFEQATTPAGRASFEAWRELYRLARCQPAR